MDRVEAYDIAHQHLLRVDLAGYSSVRENVGTASEFAVTGKSGQSYDVEICYEWIDHSNSDIMVRCRVTSLNWARHAQIEEVLKITADAI